MKVLKKILYIVGIIFFSLISAGSFFASFLFNEGDVFTFIVCFLVGLLFFYLTYLCYKGLDLLTNGKSKKVIPKEDGTISKEEISNSEDKQLAYCINLVRDCANYKQTAQYPRIESELNHIYNYLNLLKDKNHPINQYIITSLIKFLETYKEIIFTPAKDTNQGREILREIQLSLNMINNTLGKIYGAILEGEHLEISSLVNGLKTKFAMDGYLDPDTLTKKGEI